MPAGTILLAHYGGQGCQAEAKPHPGDDPSSSAPLKAGPVLGREVPPPQVVEHTIGVGPPQSVLSQSCSPP